MPECERKVQARVQLYEQHHERKRQRHDRTGVVSGTPTFAGNTMTVNLTGVADVQMLTLTLSNVTDSFAQVLPDTQVSVNMLIGDTTGDKTVNGADVAQTRGQVGMPVTSSNFRDDVQVNGAINNADVRLVKSHRGATLP